MSDIGAEIRVWAIPVLTLVIASIVTWITMSWPVGLFFLLLAAAGAGTLYILHHPGVRSWHEGRRDPERRTGRLLRNVRNAGNRVLHNRVLPGGEIRLSHVVIGPSGVYTIISGKWRKQIPMRTMYQDLFHGPDSQRVLLQRAAGQARRAEEALGRSLGRPVSITPVIVVHDAHVPWKVLTIQGVDVLAGKRLGRYLGKGNRRLSTVEIERIASAVEEALPQATERDDAPASTS